MAKRIICKELNIYLYKILIY